MICPTIAQTMTLSQMVLWIWGLKMIWWRKNWITTISSGRIHMVPHTIKVIMTMMIQLSFQITPTRLNGSWKLSLRRCQLGKSLQLSHIILLMNKSSPDISQLKVTSLNLPRKVKLLLSLHHRGVIEDILGCKIRLIMPWCQRSPLVTTGFPFPKSSPRILPKSLTLPAPENCQKST